jgi:hypothetical protein
VFGERAGLPCDADAFNETFPAPGGGASSLDCLPSTGKNVSGLGLRLHYRQTTGALHLEPSHEWTCGLPPYVTYDTCHCGVCDNDPTRACRAHEDCAEGGHCGSAHIAEPLPNQCRSEDVCLVGADGEGECETGPIDRQCDGILRADGRGFIACLSNQDCEPGTIGIDAGACTLTSLRKCFPEQIDRAGRADPAIPVLASLMCLPRMNKTSLNVLFGGPGPLARTWEGTSKFYCATDPAVEYVPGRGGCPEPKPVDPSCPVLEETVFYGKVYGQCSVDADCEVGMCDTQLGHCATTTDFDRGWTGIAHDHDINHAELRRLALRCPDDGEPGCGVCDVLGLAPRPGQCRCANDTRMACDEPFAVDQDDCGGADCLCYAGPPLPFSAGNTPTCVVERYLRDLTGSVDVDSGERQIDVESRETRYLGLNLVAPCPYCDGDLVAGDGVRDGVCVEGRHDGLACDADAVNESFPAPGGGGTSLDCWPDSGKNISGSGVRQHYEQTTASSRLSVSDEWECGYPPFVIRHCHCGVCSNDKMLACNAHADCPDGGLCTRDAAWWPQPDECGGTEAQCILAADGEGECANGPTDRFCDGIVTAAGRGFIACLFDDDCKESAIGIPAGSCTLSRKRKCFFDTVERTGSPDASNPVLASTFCLGQSSGAATNSVFGQPGPAARLWEGKSTFYCAGDGGSQYVAGSGCADP